MWVILSPPEQCLGLLHRLTPMLQSQRLSRRICCQFVLLNVNHSPSDLPSAVLWIQVERRGMSIYSWGSQALFWIRICHCMLHHFICHLFISHLWYLCKFNVKLLIPQTYVCVYKHTYGLRACDYSLTTESI